MSAFVFLLSMTAAPAQFSATVGESGLEVQGPRRAWQGRVIKRTGQANTVFVPRARVNPQQESRGAVNYRTYNTKAGAYFVVAPGSARLRKHLRFKSGVATAPVAASTPLPVEVETVTAEETAPPVEKRQEPAGAIERLRGTAAPRETSFAALSPRILGLVGVLVLGAAALFWFRRRKMPELDGDTIEIISTRVLGPKHRLSIIEAGGERLLISTSDAEVRLLSSLGAAPRFDEPVEVPALEPVSEERSDSEDVAGLLRLRDESESRDDDPARDFETVLRAVNAKQYVA
ncbi:MAG: flagellar biosynthetic protein FliO [Myxococcota bacterium]